MRRGGRLVYRERDRYGQGGIVVDLVLVMCCIVLCLASDSDHRTSGYVLRVRAFIIAIDVAIQQHLTAYQNAEYCKCALYQK